MYQPPTGVRDLLPLDVSQKLWIEQRLQRVFTRWGYQRIITPTLERMETLQASGSVDLQAILQLRDAEGVSLGLRPDPTPSLARAVATRLADAPLPVRLSYQMNVFRSTTQPQEFYQAGVELIGAGGVLADAEVLLVLAECLAELAPPDWTLILGAVAFTRSWLAQVAEPARHRLRRAMAELDRVAILAEAGIDEAVRSQLLLLFDLRGEPEMVLSKASSLPMSDAQRAELAELETLTGWLRGRSVPVVLDLSLVEAFDYYTGLIFEVSAGGRLIGRGGRYDHLLGSYGKPAPGAGFALNLEALQQVLLPTGKLPGRTVGGGFLVVPDGPDAWEAALAEADKLRCAPGERVEIELLGRTGEEAIAHGRALGAAVVRWVHPDGSTTDCDLAVIQ
ncbi:ATP phosphoribosyltransferase regulatory subunit [Gloeobacter violaceus]|uniref:ATP phosphoribosyltransferase regulatory subunit n=1 Tax=Gloeobacter violaceus (strain ATCC 29082 / PCC 7421) TaxID=251221 RepID=HISZ_GLOVI|nr:ATP phosphoribosyltransferase regulatory subunit [Gloeobacter violaceus]Q7NHZ4.1 RecName: Full=ATP phosphoribosyltransferase regulatory subunit [Gloeobacter violaceus PCC 7421]BAC90331.1 histidyl-tRNA synthetase [Gloeobacter violaceus PCC 7421]